MSIRDFFVGIVSSSLWISGQESAYAVSSLSSLSIRGFFVGGMPFGLASSRRLRHWRRSVLSSFSVGSDVGCLGLESVVCWVF